MSFDHSAHTRLNTHDPKQVEKHVMGFGQTYSQTPNIANNNAISNKTKDQLRIIHDSTNSANSLKDDAEIQMKNYDNHT